MSAAFTASPSHVQRASTPAWLLPQLVSLDAPLVASLWLTFFARTFGAAVHASEVFLIAAAVWIVYVVDHMLDVRSGALHSARHRFVQAHYSGFRSALFIVFFGALALALLAPQVIRERGLALSLVVATYLAAVHFSGGSFRRLFPKELVIAIVFAAGCSIPVWNDARFDWSAVFVFGALCLLNCASLDLWEWQSRVELLPTPHPATRFFGRRLLPGASVIALLCVFMLIDTRNLVFAASAISALLLMAVDRLRRFLPIDTVRLIADAALLTPVLFLLR